MPRCSSCSVARAGAGTVADDSDAATDAAADGTASDDGIDTGTNPDLGVDSPGDAPKEASPDAPTDTVPTDTGPSIDALCAGVDTASFQPPSVCDTASGNTSTEIPKNRIYATSWFGCYRKTDGTIFKDPTDNCLFACGNGLCASGLTGPECEASLEWFAADADRYGCGARIRVTNCANKKQVVLVTLDRGPNCKSVEKPIGAPGARHGPLADGLPVRRQDLRRDSDEARHHRARRRDHATRPREVRFRGTPRSGPPSEA